MNLTDLRDELTLLADDMEPARGASSELSAGVARRVARMKRRRGSAAVAGACAAAVVAGLAVAGALHQAAVPAAPAVPAGSANSSTVIADASEQVKVQDPATGAVLAELPRVREYDGRLYRLDGEVSVATFESRQWIVEATPANTPFLVTFGSAGVGTGDVGTDRLKGLDGDSESNSAGGQATVPQAAGPAHTVELRHDGPLPHSGVMLLAIYTMVR